MTSALSCPTRVLTLAQGAVAPWAKSKSPYFTQTIDAMAAHYGFDKKKKWKDLPDSVKEVFLRGSGGEEIEFRYDEGGRIYTVKRIFEGVIPNMERRYKETDSAWSREEMERFQNNRPCGTCHGYRLRPEALAVKIAGMHAGQVVQMSIKEAHDWIGSVPATMTNQQNEIARAILKEIRERLGFLVNVGLNYLTMSRNAGTLSGGESQRIRLASQIGVRPDRRALCAGRALHRLAPSATTDRLLTTLKNLRDAGNTVLVGGALTRMRSARADLLVQFDMGPGAGVAWREGYLSRYAGADCRRSGQHDRAVSVGPAVHPGFQGAPQGQWQETDRGQCRPGNNLKNMTAEFPLGRFVCVTGVSGGGKSTLTIETLFKTAATRLNPAAHELRLRPVQKLDPRV